jgi:hypothetical protein
VGVTAGSDERAGALPTGPSPPDSTSALRLSVFFTGSCSRYRAWQALHAVFTSSSRALAAPVSTGVYWTPVWHVLEGHATLVLANAKQIRSIPGRKSDKNDATWINDLLALGLDEARLTTRLLQRPRDLGVEVEVKNADAGKDLVQLHGLLTHV